MSVFEYLQFHRIFSLSTKFPFFYVFVKVSSHSEPSSQSLSLQQSGQPPPPPLPPPQPQYGLPVPESRDKQLCFSDFEDLSASFRSLYKCVFEQSFSQQGKCHHHCGLLMPASTQYCVCLYILKKEPKHNSKRLSALMHIINWHA